MTRTTTLFLCRICGQAKDETGRKPTNPLVAKVGAEVQSLLAETPEVKVELTDCLSVCTRPLVWGLRAPGKHAFTMALPSDDAAQDPEALAAALAAQARTYHQLPLGQKMGKDTFPPRLKGTLISRLPPLPDGQA